MARTDNRREGKLRDKQGQNNCSDGACTIRVSRQISYTETKSQRVSSVVFARIEAAIQEGHA